MLVAAAEPGHTTSTHSTPHNERIAHREYQRLISLPIYSRMSDRDVQEVIDAVTDIVEKGRR